MKNKKVCDQGRRIGQGALFDRLCWAENAIGLLTTAETRREGGKTNGRVILMRLGTYKPSWQITARCVYRKPVSVMLLRLAGRPSLFFWGVFGASSSKFQKCFPTGSAGLPEVIDLISSIKMVQLMVDFVVASRLVDCSMARDIECW